METSPNNYRIRIQGEVPERWQAWFGPFTMSYLPDADTLLQGQIVDQSQLIGVINQIHNLNLKLISVNAIEDRERSIEPGDCS